MPANAGGAGSHPVSTPLYKRYGPSTATVVVLASWLLLPAAFGQGAPAPELSESAIVAPEAGIPPGPTLVRVTSSFEVTHAAAVLRQVAKLFSAGFVRKDAEQMARMIDALAAEQSRTWEFSGVRKGVTYPLRVRARIDEFGMLDLDFFTVPAMVSSVRGAVDGYLNARGL
jgi:hypothetical protein